jgi:carbamoyl-phosphate synthase small subunit
MEGMDYVREVSTDEGYHWDQDSRRFTLPNVVTGQESHWMDLPPVRHRIVAFDFGIKYNILRRLRQAGFDVQVVNSRTRAEDVLSLNPDGVFLSNGPGDPEPLVAEADVVRAILGRVPVLGICLGHQLLGLATGHRTYKLPFGHRGANHPVLDRRTGRVLVTSQNHGFAVAATEDAEATHVSLYDGTVEGFSFPDVRAESVQFHPEAGPGPHDAWPILETWVEGLGR